MLHKEGFAFAGVEFLHRNQARRWNSILPAPCRILSDFVSAAKPGNVSRDGEDFWRRRRQFPILTFRSPFGVNGGSCRIFATKEAVDNAIGKSVQPA